MYRRGHEKIAAFLEWNLEVPGVRNHYQSTDKTASSSSSRGTCGLQVGGINMHHTFCRKQMFKVVGLSEKSKKFGLSLLSFL